jgi:redox-sensitive bicupin YhaK (pirin superfamily)
MDDSRKRVGRGIIHEEYHSTDLAKTGGTFEMCQLWLNLPAVHKKHAPRYQPILSGSIPVVPLRSAPVEACATGGKSAEPPPDEGLGSVRVGLACY